MGKSRDPRVGNHQMDMDVVWSAASAECVPSHHIVSSRMGRTKAQKRKGRKLLAGSIDTEDRNKCVIRLRWIQFAKKTQNSLILNQRSWKVKLVNAYFFLQARTIFSDGYTILLLCWHVIVPLIIVPFTLWWKQLFKKKHLRGVEIMWLLLFSLSMWEGCYTNLLCCTTCFCPKGIPFLSKPLVVRVNWKPVCTIRLTILAVLKLSTSPLWARPPQFAPTDSTHDFSPPRGSRRKCFLNILSSFKLIHRSKQEGSLMDL